MGRLPKPQTAFMTWAIERISDLDRLAGGGGED